MSKHQKELRRERRKTDRARRLMARFRHPTSHIKHGAAALAAAAAIAAGTQAYADPIRFDNPAPGEPGHFDWTGSEPYLDITLPSADQPGVSGAIGVLRQTSDRVVSGTATKVQVGQLYEWCLAGVDAGELIPTSGYSWHPHGAIIGDYGSLLPEGQLRYLGAGFDPGDGYHYGWVAGVRTGYDIETFAWGYETEVGVPIPAGAIPEPGSLALLAFGAAAVAGRRRR